MLIWTPTDSRLDAKSPYQGGPIASVYEEGGKWWVRWWVGPVGIYKAPSEATARRWVERFAASRLDALGKASASAGAGPNALGRYVSPTPEEQARYDAFSAKYVPPKRPNRRRR